MGQLTAEDIMNTKEYKVIKTILKKTYPFIIDIRLTDNWNNYDTSLFIDAIVDPFKLKEYAGDNLSTTMMNQFARYVKDKEMWGTTLSSLGVKKEFSDKVSENIQKKINLTHKSDILPKEDKVPHWGIHVSVFAIPVELLKKFYEKSNN
jgi:hypothetical protein